MELAEEYVHAVSSLTIDDAERLWESNLLKTATIQKIEDEKETRISDLEKIVRRLQSDWRNSCLLCKSFFACMNGMDKDACPVCRSNLKEHTNRKLILCANRLVE